MANLSNINNKFIVTDVGTGQAIVGATNAVSGSTITVGGAGTFSGNVLLSKTLNSALSSTVSNLNSGNASQSRFLAVSNGGNIQLKSVSTLNTTYGVGDVGVINCDTMSGGFKIAHNDVVKYTLAFNGDNTWTNGGTFGGSTLLDGLASNGYRIYKIRLQAPYTGGWGSITPGTVIGGLQQTNLRTDNGQNNIAAAVDFELENNIYGTGQTLISFKCGGVNGVNSTEKMRILSNGDVCIGTTSPSSNNNYGTGDLNVENDVFASAQVFTHNSTAGNYSFFGLGKSSGTGASPTIVQAQETVGEIRYYGYDGNDYRALAVIGADVDGTPGDDDMPGRIEFGTTADGAITPTTRMVIGQQGVVTIGASKRYVDSANTQFDLEVTEGMAFGGAAFTYATIQGDSAGHGNIEICANAYPANTGAESKITFKTSTTSGGQYPNALVVKGPYVGIGTDSPDAQLHINAPTGNVSLILSHTQNVQNSFIDFNGNSGGTQARIAYSDALGDISISPNFSTGPSMTLRNNNRVGIGITNPTRQLSVISRIACVVSGTTANAAILFGDDDDDSVGQVRYNNSDDSMELRTDSTERIRIDSSGDVTIQTSGADDIKNFTINSSNGSSNVAGLIIQNDGANGYINFKLGSGNAAPATKLTIGNAANFGNVGFGVTSPNALLSTANSNSYTQEWTFAKGYRHFTTYPAGSTGNYNISTKISFNNLRGITVDYYESGHLFNNGAAVYFRHTRFYIMMEGSTLRINDAVLIRSTGNRTDAIVNAPAVTTNASLECLITSTIKSGFTHYVAADIVGTGFNRIVSIS